MMHKLISVLVLTTTLAACGAGTDTVTDTCNRLDECNVLNTSVSDCTEELDLALTQATPSEQNDWELLMNDCLAFEGCSTFLACIGADDGGGGSGSDGGGGGGGETPDGPSDPIEPAPGN